MSVRDSLEEAAAEAAASHIQKQQPEPGVYSLIALCSGEARPELRMMEILAEKGYALKRVWLIDLQKPPEVIFNRIKAIVASSGTPSASRIDRVKCLTFPEMTEELKHKHIDYKTTHCISVHFQIIAESHPRYENGRRWRHWSEWMKEGYNNKDAIDMQNNDIAAIKKLVYSDVGQFFKKWMGVRRPVENQKSIGFAARDGRVWEVTPSDVMWDGKKLSDIGFYNRVNNLQIKARDEAPNTSVIMGGKRKDLKTSTKRKSNHTKQTNVQ
jgi:hypothetical protein